MKALRLALGAATVFASETLEAEPDKSYCKLNEHSVNVTALPFAEDGLHPCQYAGTFKVNQTEDHHLFYWFFRHEDPDAPLLLWLNGGPGASSMFGLFLENGPLRVTKGDGDAAFKLSPAEHAWTDDYNVIFLDQPVGTGFSFGDSYLTSMSQGASEFLDFMIQFLEHYPEFQTRDLHLTGESYAGKYLPLFTFRVLEYNKHPTNTMKIPLKTTMIGDPYPSPVLQRTHMHLVPRGLNVIDDVNLDQISALEQHCQEDQTIDPIRGGETCRKIMSYIEAVSGGVFPYNAQIFGYDWEPKEDLVIQYLANSSHVEELYKVIHIDQSTKSPTFEMGSERVGKGYEADQLVDYSFYYNYLIENGYPLIVMAGEADMQDGAAGQEVWMKQTLQLPAEFWTQDRQIYYFRAPGEDLTRVGGYFRQTGNFTFITTPKSGHFMPADNYFVSRAYLDDYTSAGSLQCIEKTCRVNT